MHMLQMSIEGQVMIFADVVQTFRDVRLMMDKFEIYPAHHVSARQMALDAMVKKTGVEVDLISDHAMYRIMESRIRGGVCVISNRYAKPNNAALGPLYDPNFPNNYIISFHLNKIYRWAMSSFLPHDSFDWVPQEELEQIYCQGIGD